MKKVLMDLGVIILFYSVIIFGILLLNNRMKSLNALDNNTYLVSVNS